MTRVTGTDHVLVLLRETLARSGRERTGRAGGAARPRVEARPLDRLRAMAGLDALGEDERRRAVMLALLTDELGDGVANDPAFAAILDRVVRIIGTMPDGGRLIDRAAAQLRGD